VQRFALGLLERISAVRCIAWADMMAFASASYDRSKIVLDAARASVAADQNAV